MDDYIRRADALAVFGDIHPQDYNTIAYAERIKNIPPSNVQPLVKGKWIWNGDGFYYYCSNCHCGAYGNSLEIYEGSYNFCPVCGADMRRNLKKGVDNSDTV